MALLAGPAFAGCNSKECERRVERKQCNRGSVTACLHVAARRHGVSHSLLRAIAVCESGLNPRAQNPASTALGLFQWLDTSWAGLPHRFSSRSRTSPRWASLASAWAIRHYGTSPWLASKHCWA